MRTYLLALVVFVCWHAQADEMLFKVSGSYKGRRYESLVMESRIAKAPKWRESRENPPLPARKAMTFARKQLSGIAPDFADWSIQRLVLEPVGGKGMWIYVIDFEPPIPSDGLEGMPFFVKIIVLMDGSTITPALSEVGR